MLDSRYSFACEIGVAGIFGVVGLIAVRVDQCSSRLCIGRVHGHLDNIWLHRYKAFPQWP